MANILYSSQVYGAVIAIFLMHTSWAQRPFYAGIRPAPGLNQLDKYNPVHTSTTTARIPQNPPKIPPPGTHVVLPEPENIDFNFGIPASSTTQRPMPVDAGGDQLLIDYLNGLPPYKRPFWFLNYIAIEKQRNSTVDNSSGTQFSRGSFSG